MRQTGEQHALQSDPSERIDQLARRDSATRDMGTDRCPIDVEAVEPNSNWPEFEISVHSRSIVSRPCSSPRPNSTRGRFEIVNVTQLYLYVHTHLGHLQMVAKRLQAIL